MEIISNPLFFLSLDNTGTTWEEGDGDHELNTNPNAIISSADDEQSGFFERLGARTELFLGQFFTAWGTKCARNSGIVLFLGFCFVVGLGHGVKFLYVTTDPVELWASPTSRSRIEREYFDKNFEPFYRIEQVSLFLLGFFCLSFNKCFFFCFCVVYL